MDSKGYITELQGSLDALPMHAIEDAISILWDARMNNHQVFIMGNGGSASTASHFVCDLAKNTKKEGWPNFRVIGLTDNNALITALANDEGYENVFAQQLASFIQPGDVVIAISASGNSPNVLKAIELANEINAKTIGFTGFDGGKLCQMVQLNINIPSNYIEHVEDIHLVLEHMITKALRDSMSEESTSLFREPIHFMQRMDHIELSTDYSNGIPMVTTNVNGMKGQRLVADLLQQMFAQLNDTPNLHAFLQQLLGLTIEGIGAESGSVVMLNEKGQAVEGALAYGGTIEVRPAPVFQDVIAHGLAGWVVQNRESVLVQSTLDDPRWLPRAWESSNGSNRSAISVPLTMQDKVFGVVTLVSQQAHQFSQEDMALLTAIAVSISLNRSIFPAFQQKAAGAEAL
jgi:D-sedoheptulose 7-phosphate isomerase